MIDALAAIIRYLATDADLNALTSARIAARHRFGMSQSGWPQGASALTIAYAGASAPDLEGGSEAARLEARCWAESQEAAAAIYNRLVSICGAFIRTTVPTNDGTALIYWLVPEGGADFDRDPDLNSDYIRLYLSASVARTPV